MHSRLDDVLADQARIEAAIHQHPAPRLLYVFPTAVPGGPIIVQPAAMRASQDFGIPCVNGWSGHAPKGWDFFSSHDQVMAWLTTNGTPPEVIAGLVLVEGSSAHTR
jgi:hypothetical protein